MPQINDHLNRYLDHLNLDVEKPSYDYLERICHAHLTTFPFENISKLIYFREHHYSTYKIPSFELFIENFSRFNYGGTCYTLNSNLMILLRELGFDCYHVMLGEEHMGIIVKMNNAHLYVDCGAAAPFFKPVRFEVDPENISAFGKDSVQIIPVEPQKNRYKYVRYTNGKQNGKTWHFHAQIEADVSEFTNVIEKSNKPNAPFMTILRCQLYQTEKQRSVSLLNNTFSIRYSNGSTFDQTLSSARDIKEVLSEEFELAKLPVAEAIDVLKTLNVEIFAQRTK